MSPILKVCDGMENSTFCMNFGGEIKLSCANPFYTIGHSTLALADFIALLLHYNVTMIADVKAFPYSRRNREYDAANLQPELALHGVGYRHFPELGILHVNFWCSHRGVGRCDDEEAWFNWWNRS